MAQVHKSSFGVRLIFTALLCVIGLAAIALLSTNVVSDLKLFKSASSDNVQWTLSQTEVEFLEFEIGLEAAARNPSPDLMALRRHFDIFYSRINTLGEASIYASLRKLPEFSNNLRTMQAFLRETVDLIDAPDAELTAGLLDLAERATKVRGSVRKLSNSGLNYFANQSDMRRDNVADTLTQMAFGVTVLMLALLLLALYLGHLNRQNIRRRSQAIQASKRMNIVTGTALDAVVVCDVDGRILDFNEAAVQIFGYSAKEAIGSDLGALIVPDHHRDAHDAGMHRMRHGGEKHVVGKGRISLEAKRSNGELFPVEFAIQSAETEEGEIYISFLRDISHRVAAEKALVEARDRALSGEKSKTDFLATMSHEIRTPLNGLLGNLTLMHDTKLTANQARYVRNMETSGKLLMSHISDVLDVTKYDAGKLTLRPVKMNISKLLQDIVDNQSGSAAAKNTTLTWEWSGPKTDWIFADEERIQHILMNVIGNAVKFTNEGHIGIQAKVVGDTMSPSEIQIIVRDTGVGMADELKSQIFDDFMTGDVSYDRDVGGTGLGLGIAQRFVKALGGSIEVESEAGKGSAFAIQFPIEPTSPPEIQKNVKGAASKVRPSHILLVEDNEINRVVAREMLLAEGHTVTEAHNGKIAVYMTRSEDFDLILMDISMPVMDGRAATRAIRASDSQSALVPIIALTANAMAEEQAAFLSDGMNDILTKPLSRQGLVEVLAKHIASENQSEEPAVAPAETIENMHLEELKDTIGSDSLRPLLERFHIEVDETLDYLLSSAGQPLEQIAQRAHKIAGSAATLGAGKLRDALIVIEIAAKQDDSEAVIRGIDALPKVWEAIRGDMRVE